MSIRLTINGEARSVVAATVSSLLEELGLDYRRLAVELNRQIVPRGTYTAATLQDGDAIELVHLVGGG